MRAKHALAYYMHYFERFIVHDKAGQAKCPSARLFGTGDPSDEKIGRLKKYHTPYR